MQKFTAKAYHSFLTTDYPAFLDEYIALPVMQRLAGVGLLCGTDWTPLFHNAFFYSRLDHSVGTALIVWNFTHSKKQTVSALFHDVATPAFSHVVDFRNGDRLKQESTEKSTARIINEDIELSELLFRDGIYKYEMDDYHKYPVADNDIPGLSADRLEYMYPSAAALDGTWELSDVQKNYSDIVLLKNEQGLDELGFAHEEAALEYMQKFSKIGLLVQKNEDKIAMQLLADVVSEAIKCGYIDEEELYALDELSIIARFEDCADMHEEERFAKLFRTFRSMTSVIRSQTPLDGCYCISFDVKKRYVDPLVRTVSGTQRISHINADAAKCIADFLAFKDSPYGCVKYWSNK